MLSSFARRGISVTAALTATATLIGAGLAAPAAATPRPGPTITIRVGGVRTADDWAGMTGVSGLAGATFSVSGGNLKAPVTCVSTAAGLCTVSVPGGSTYTVTQTGAPGGWFASTALGAGTVSPAAVTTMPYDTLGVTVGSSGVTVPAAASDTDTSPTARSGTWALSHDDPSLTDQCGCGLRIALLFDLSGSTTPGALSAYQAAGRSLVNALQGTGSSIGVYTFGTTAPAPSTTGSDNATLAPVSVATAGGVAALDTKIDGLSLPAGSDSNWDAGLWQIAQDNAADHYQAVFVLTDGDATRDGPAASPGGLTSPVTSRFAETENAIFSANALKNAGTTVVGVGAGPEGPADVDNLIAISGPAAGTDYLNTSLASLPGALKGLVLPDYTGIDIAASASPRTVTHAGQTVAATYTVTNPRRLTLNDVHVTDDHVSGPVSCSPSTLATGGTATCHATYTISQADVDAGRVTTVARATGTTQNGDVVTSSATDQTITAPRTPGIRIVSSAFPASYGAAGETIGYTYTVSDTGNVTLHGVRATDDTTRTAAGCLTGTLAPGQSTTCQAPSRTITAADLTAGHVTTAATVTGYPPTGAPVTAASSQTVDATLRPAIQIGVTSSPSSYGAAGETIGFSYTVVNAGNAPLHGIGVTDPGVGPVTCPVAMLAPGASMTCHANHVTTSADVTAGHIASAPVVTGAPPSGASVTATSGATVHAVLQPAIKVGVTASPSGYGAAGETIGFSYTVTNTGDAALHGIGITDPRVGPVTCPVAMLAPGASMTCHATHVTSSADVTAGHIASAPVVTGAPPSGAAVTATSGTTVGAVLRPGVRVGVAASPPSYGAAGERIGFSYTVTNTGDAALHGIGVTDPRVGPVTCPVAMLAPGASMTCHATHVTTGADVTAGHIASAPVVTGAPASGTVVTGTGSGTVSAVLRPAIRVGVTAFPASYGAAGETIGFSYPVTNTGNAPLHGIGVTDPGVGPVTCPVGMLAPGASMTCHATHVTTGADVTAGHIASAPVVTGAPPSGAAVTGTGSGAVGAVLSPGLQLRIAASPASYSAAGQPIGFSYTVVNTGNETVDGIAVTDPGVGPVTCPVTMLAAGASMTCHATHVTTLADLAAGHIASAPVVTGHAASGTPVTAAASQTVGATLRPAIRVGVTAFPRAYAVPGERITYSDTVTNTGTATLHGVSVTNAGAGPVTCPVTMLAAGASMTCHATHVTTFGDVAAGHIAGAVTATGNSAAGAPATGTAGATVGATPWPGVQVGVTTFPGTYAAPGEQVTYSDQVVNTGDTTLNGISVTDPGTGPATCPATTLAPGASMTCSATHVATSADVAAGHIAGAAVVTGATASGTPVTGTDPTTIDAVLQPGIQLQMAVAPVAASAAGETISLTDTVVNTGNDPLHNITIIDDLAGSVGCPATTLAPGAAMTCGGTHTVSAAALTAAHGVDIGTAAADPPTGPRVVYQDAVVVPALPAVPVTG